MFCLDASLVVTRGLGARDVVGGYRGACFHHDKKDFEFGGMSRKRHQARRVCGPDGGGASRW